MNDRKYRCYYIDCLQFFHNKYNLRRHINSFHLKLKSYKCHMCSRKVVSKQSLQEHINIHTGDKPYICTYPNCRKTFRQSSRLSLHKLTHHNLRTEKEESHNELSIFNLLEKKGVSEYDPDLINKHEESYKLPKITRISSKAQICIKLPVLPILLNHIELI